MGQAEGAGSPGRAGSSRHPALSWDEHSPCLRVAKCWWIEEGQPLCFQMHMGAQPGGVNPNIPLGIGCFFNTVYFSGAAAAIHPPCWVYAIVSSSSVCFLSGFSTLLRPYKGKISFSPRCEIEGRYLQSLASLLGS